MSGEVVIATRGLTKSYRLFGRPGDRIKQFLTLGLKTYHREFTALKNVSFEIRRGESVGIIGRNGSGKSTLLQLICGILKPTSGTLQVKGRISALLELGAGFNPEFTGRENVYFQSALMGFNATQVDACFDDIAAFADIGEFIDQPVRTYSSGMFVRLAFATTVHTNPEIVVVDEALAVGDEAFQRKCFARLRALRDSGGTILFVTHAPNIVLDLCTRALLLDAGEHIAEGDPKHVVDSYQKLIYAPPSTKDVVRNDIRLRMPDLATAGAPSGVERPDFDPALLPTSTVAYPAAGARISRPRIMDVGGNSVNILDRGGEYSYCYDVDFEQEACSVVFGAMIKTATGFELGGFNSHTPGNEIPVIFQGRRAEVSFRFRCALLPGVYFMNCGVLGRTAEHQGFLHRIIDAVMFRVRPERALLQGGVVDFGTHDAVIAEVIQTPPPSRT